jgi:hypothetical protein
MAAARRQRVGAEDGGVGERPIALYHRLAATDNAGVGAGGVRPPDYRHGP